MSNNIKCRNLISLVALSFFLIQCTTGTRVKNEEALSKESFKTLDTLIPFSGSWLTEDYYNNVRASKSPSGSQDESNFINIPDHTLKTVTMVYGFHEGNNELIILKGAGNYQLWEFRNDSVAKFVSDIVVQSENKIKIGEKLFVKINPVYKDGSSLILEEILFKGKYTNSAKQSIEFNNDGTVTGMGNFRYYKPAIDYMDAGMQVDQIAFGVKEDKLQWHAFKFNGDTLEIFKLKCVTFDSTYKLCDEVAFGEMVYKFWKL